MPILAIFAVAFVLGQPPLVQATEQQAQPNAPKTTDHAKRGARKWWAEEKFRQALHLTTEQVKALDKIFEDAFPKQRDLWEALRSAEREVDKLWDAEILETRKLTAAIETAEFYRYKYNEGRMMMLVKMHHQLTPAQRRTFRELRRDSQQPPRPPKFR